MPKRFLTASLVIVFVALGTLGAFSFCTSAEGDNRESEITNEEAIKIIAKAYVDLKSEFEAHLRTHPTGSNDHYHGLSDSFIDPGYHTHSEYAWNEHDHWGYAAEFHTHDRYGY